MIWRRMSIWMKLYFALLGLHLLATLILLFFSYDQAQDIVNVIVFPVYILATIIFYRKNQASNRKLDEQYEEILERHRKMEEEGIHLSPPPKFGADFRKSETVTFVLVLLAFSFVLFTSIKDLVSY